MTKPLSFVPVPEHQLVVGQPLPWPIYDWSGNLLLAAGVVVQSKSQLDGLIGNGFFHNAKWDEGLTHARLTAPVIARSSENSTPSGASTLKEKKIDPSQPREASIEMDDVQWIVGETLYLQLLDNPSIRYTVKLIGYVKNQTVLITSPTVDGKYEFIREGQGFIVRAFSGKSAYAFTTVAEKTVYSPHPYLHLSYPKQIRSTAVRQSVRAQVELIAAVSFDAKARAGAAVLNDLSIGGAGGNMREQIAERGDEGRIKFRLEVEGHDHYLDLSFTLRALEPNDQSSGYKCGFQFTSLTAQDKVILSAFVHQALVAAT